MRARSYIRTSLLLLFFSAGTFAQDGRDSIFSNPNDPGRVFNSRPPTIESDAEIAAGAARAAAGPSIIDPISGLELRAEGRGVIDTFYDTGFIGSSPLFLPSTIAVDGTPAAHGRGRFGMTAAGSQVSIDLRAPGVSGVPQAYTEFDFVDASGAAPANFRLRKAFGVVDLPNSARLIGGQLYTTFGAEDLRPFSIINDGTPAGAVFRRQPLLRYTVGDNVGLSRSIAIENPTSTDFTLLDPVNDTPLQRAPDLAANVRWVSPDDPMNRAQLAMLVRGFGYEDQFNSEHFLTGWGVSAMSRVRTFGDDSVQLGIVGGQGLGQYIFGFGAATDVVAAGPNPAGQLTTLPTVGAYLGYQHFLTRDIFANVAYGYAHVDTTPIMNPLSARQTQDAWANIVFALSEQLFLGIEYHYGILEVNSGATGDNHRIQTTLSYLAK